METRLAAATAAIEAVGADLAETRTQDEETERELAALPDPALARAALDATRLAAIEARDRESDARTELDKLSRDAEARHARLSTIGVEQRSWRQRGEGLPGSARLSSNGGQPSSKKSRDSRLARRQSPRRARR